MTGGLYLHATLSITQLKKELAEREWKLEVNIPNDRQPYQDVSYGGDALFKGMSEQDLAVSLLHVAIGFTVRVGMEFFTRIGYEFFTVDDALTPYVEKMKQDINVPLNKYISGYIFPSNDGEDRVWD